MIVLIRLEAEAPSLTDVIANLDGAEAAVMALQSETPPDEVFDPAKHGMPHNVGVTDEHYERMNGSETYFKGRRVLKFLGRAGWDDNNDLDRPQPRLAAAYSTTPPTI